MMDVKLFLEKVHRQIHPGAEALWCALLVWGGVLIYQIASVAIGLQGSQSLGLQEVVKSLVEQLLVR